MSTYSSNVIHDQGRPASYYGGGGPADGPPPRRPSRMSHHESVYSQSRHNGRAATHYGHLVSEEPRRNIMCGGDSCSACCKYNTLACLFCCNGWLRLCGCGMSIREILKFK
ncbi:hypothetical protein H4R26_003049 [Coemansia thaxteri]|uniref:Uncharacterized protein n=1 Tax=Coemansia thaxteri TaxID=2663907 RepID=A0A9W8BHN7_9FUNG|nr:hypothetical protein H4R26_003049 [Coemansia thaxteri]